MTVDRTPFVSNDKIIIITISSGSSSSKKRVETEVACTAAAATAAAADIYLLRVTVLCGIPTRETCDSTQFAIEQEDNHHNHVETST